MGGSSYRVEVACGLALIWTLTVRIGYRNARASPRLTCRSIRPLSPRAEANYFHFNSSLRLARRGRPHGHYCVPYKPETDFTSPYCGFFQRSPLYSMKSAVACAISCP